MSGFALGFVLIASATAVRGCERIGTGTFATADFPAFSPFRLGASPIFSQPRRATIRHWVFECRSGPDHRNERILALIANF
jgi:hypothetical protein